MSVPPDPNSIAEDEVPSEMVEADRAVVDEAENRGQYPAGDSADQCDVCSTNEMEIRVWPDKTRDIQHQADRKQRNR